MLSSALISPLSIAPMIDWTYTHFRVLMRMLAPEALLYTEMQTIGAMTHQPERAFFFQPIEHPIALQVGGSSPEGLARMSIEAEHRGFSEVNLNLGCPSDKVLAGQFGACLMRDPQKVAECIKEMKRAVSIPITAKIRIGVDNEDSYEFFEAFVRVLIQAGCDKVIVHARKAWLHGLSPKQNRTVPPLNYDYVVRLKQQFPELPVVMNGNIQTVQEVHEHLLSVDGVMLGRLACNDPYHISIIHHALFPHHPIKTRAMLLNDYMAYAVKQTDIPLSLLFKPILNLAHGLPHARTWKMRLLSLKSLKADQALFDVCDLLITNISGFAMDG